MLGVKLVISLMVHPHHAFPMLMIDAVEVNRNSLMDCCKRGIRVPERTMKETNNPIDAAAPFPHYNTSTEVQPRSKTNQRLAIRGGDSISTKVIRDMPRCKDSRGYNTLHENAPKDHCIYNNINHQSTSICWQGNLTNSSACQSPTDQIHCSLLGPRCQHSVSGFIHHVRSHTYVVCIILHLAFDT